MAKRSLKGKCRVNLKKLDTWHKTRAGYLVFGLVGLGLAYLFISLAFSGGSLWYYLLTLIFVIGFLQNLVKLILMMGKAR